MDLCFNLSVGAPDWNRAQTAAARCVAGLGIGAALAALPLDVHRASASILSEDTLLRRYIVTSGEALLRYSLPIGDSADKLPIRKLQLALEKLDIDLRSKGPAALRGARKDLKDAEELLTAGQQLNIALDVPKARRDLAIAEVKAAADDVQALGKKLEAELGKDKLKQKKKKGVEEITIDTYRSSALQHVSNIETLMAPDRLPYRIPAAYNHLPRLVGRGEAEFILKKKPGEVFRDSAGKELESVPLRIVLDGYSAPLTSGNVLDLVQRGFYDDVRFIATERGHLALLDGKGGFLEDGRRREIPLEVRVDGDLSPLWGSTLESNGIGDLQVTLPPSAFGATSLIHSDQNVNDGSAQICFFLYDPRSMTARSRYGGVENGNYSNFGYVVRNQEYLTQIEPGDRIERASVISGLDRLVQGTRVNTDARPARIQPDEVMY